MVSDNEMQLKLLLLLYSLSHICSQCALCFLNFSFIIFDLQVNAAIYIYADSMIRPTRSFQILLLGLSIAGEKITVQFARKI